MWLPTIPPTWRFTRAAQYSRVSGVGHLEEGLHGGHREGDGVALPTQRGDAGVEVFDQPLDKLRLGGLLRPGRRVDGALQQPAVEEGQDLLLRVGVELLLTAEER